VRRWLGSCLRRPDTKRFGCNGAEALLTKLLKMRTAGARVTKEPVDAEFFKGRSAYWCDPEANYFEITWAEPNNPITAWRHHLPPWRLFS